MIIVYTKGICNNCKSIENFFASQGIKFQTINVRNDPEARKFVLAHHCTVPQIYFGDHLFVENGWDGLRNMSKQEILERIEKIIAYDNRT